MLRDFISHLGIDGHPFSQPEADACILHFMQSRMRPTPILGWPRVSQAAHCLSDASRIAAASRAAGYDLPSYAGPRTRAWCEARGAKDRPEHSRAHPLQLRHIIAARPAASSTHYGAWCALFVMSLFCLRTGIVFHIYSDMFIPYDDGFLLVWQHAQKRTRSDVRDEASFSRIATISAARHPLLASVIRRGEANRRLFPEVTSASISSFVRERLPEAPPGFDVRTYGARVSADTDATALHLPDDVCCRLFWWKRPTQLMLSYYSGVNIRAAFVFCELRLTLSYNHVGAGTFDVSAPSSSIIDWRHVGSDSVLPSPPSFEDLLAAYRCVSLSYMVLRSERARVRAVTARREAGEQSDTPSGSVVSVLEAPCCLCASFVTSGVRSGACLRCKAVVCLACHPDPDTDFRCRAHRPANKRRRRT